MDSAAGAFNHLVLKRNTAGATAGQRGEAFTGWKAPEVVNKPNPMKDFRV
jgi:hypothetical protein